MALLRSFSRGPWLYRWDHLILRSQCPPARGILIGTRYLRLASSNATPRPSLAPSKPTTAPTPAKSPTPTKLAYPERILIYHAGTGRIIFMSFLKLTSIIICAFFVALVAPGYYRAGKPYWEVAGVALCGVIPVLLIGYSTSPLVLFMHLQVPHFARRSRDILERFVKTLPPGTQMYVTTMNWLTRPRHTVCAVDEFHAARRRMGIVNFVTEVKGKPVVEYNIQGTNRGIKEGWVWEALKKKAARSQ